MPDRRDNYYERFEIVGPTQHSIHVFSSMNFGLKAECKIMKNMKALGEEKTFIKWLFDDRDIAS